MSVYSGLERRLLPRAAAAQGLASLYQGVAAAWRTQSTALVWGLVLPALVLPIWFFGARAGWLPPQILPAPHEVWDTLRDMVTKGELQHHAGFSLLRVAYGFAIGAGAGLALGAAMGLSHRLEDHVRPTLTALAQVPTLAWIPLLMLFLGIGETLKIVVIAKGAFVPIVFNTLAGIRNVPKTYVEVGDVFRFSAAQRLRLVVLPAAVPTIFTGIRFGLSHAWIALMSVELLASSEGLGYLLVWGRQMFWLDTVIVAMIVIGLVGYLTDRILASVERRLQRWRIANG